MRSIAVGLAVAVMASALCSCGAARSSKYYELTIPSLANSPPAAQLYTITLLIAPITASHLYRGDRVVYATGSEMGTYEYQRWAEPPTEMMEAMLLRELRASGRYRGVHAQTSSASGDYLIRGHLYDFKEVSGSTLLARVTVELELRELRTGTTVWAHFYTHDEPVARKDISEVISALDRNVQQGVNEFAASLDQYFGAHITTQAQGSQ